MDAPIIGRWVRPFHSVRALGLCLLATIGVGSVEADTPGTPFRVHASVSPKAAVQSGSGFQLRARLAPLRVSQVGAGYELSAKASMAPLVCTDDTIFIDGFDL